MTLRAVIFDLDGTLLDTAPDFILAVNRLRQEHQLHDLPADKIRSTVSNGGRALLQLALDIEPGHEQFEPGLARLLELYSQQLAVESRLFPGIQALLQQLAQHNIHWGIATNKPSKYTQPLMAALALKPAPKAVICPDHIANPKPHPAALQLACEQIGCQPAEAIFIGDHRRDIECGKNAAMKTVAAAYGYIEDCDPPQSWQADHLINHADEIWPLLQQYR